MNWLNWIKGKIKGADGQVVPATQAVPAPTDKGKVSGQGAYRATVERTWEHLNFTPSHKAVALARKRERKARQVQYA